MQRFLEDSKNKALFEEMICRSNFRVIDEIVNKRSEEFCKKLISIYMNLNPDWRDILAKGELEKIGDIYRTKNDDSYCPDLVLKNKAAVKSFIDEINLNSFLNNVNNFHKEPSEFGPINMNDFDLAALVSILQHRFFGGTYGRNNSKIKNLCKTIRCFRILIGHKNNEIITLANDCSKYYKFYRPSNPEYVLETSIGSCNYHEMCQNATAVANDERLHQSYRSAAVEYLAELRRIMQTEDFIKDGPAISWDFKNKLRSDYLVGYNIFFMASALIRNESAVAFFKSVCMLTSTLNTNKYTNGKTKYGICIFKSDYDAIMNDSGRNGKRGRKYSAIINDYYHLIRIIEKDTQNPEDFFADKKDKYCIFTAFDDTAKRIKGLGKQNVIAAYIEDSTFFRVYSQPLNNALLERSNLNLQNIGNISENDFLLQLSKKLAELGKQQTENGIPESAFTQPDEVPETGNIVSIVYSDGSSEKIKLGEEAAPPGGEGCIYRFADENEIIKIYREDKWSSNTFDKLAAMRDIPQEMKRKLKDNRICWPKDFVLFKNRCVGFTMKKVPEGAVTLEKLLSDLSSNEWRLDRRNLVNLCIKILERFIFLHSQNILMGDVNLKNIMITKPFEKSGDTDVYFIDADSYQYKDFLCTAGVEDFASPRILEKQIETGKGFALERTLEDELYAEIILVFVILFCGDYPFLSNGDLTTLKREGRYRFAKDKRKREEFSKDKYDKINANLSEGMRTLFDDVFCSRETEKYTEDDVIDLLHDYYDQIQPNISDNAEIGDEAEPGLSNQITPTGDPNGENWKVVKCRSCGRGYWKTENSSNKNNSCPDCLQIRDTEEAMVYECVCIKCGKAFKINKYMLRDNNYLDSHDKLTGDVICYNCNDSNLFLHSMEDNKFYLNNALKEFYSFRRQIGQRIPIGPLEQEDER